jgi:hypothetical protein
MADNTAYAAAELATELRENPTEFVADWAMLINDEKAVEMLNHLEATFGEPAQTIPKGLEIIQRHHSKAANQAGRTGNISQMKAATGLTNQSKQKDKFFVEVADRLTYEGAIGLMFGSPGSGKTSTVLDIAQVWRAITGGYVIANIEWEGADATFSSDTEMLELMASYKGPVLSVLDEIAQELSGFGTGSKAAETFSDSLLFIRKQEDRHGDYAKRGSVISVAHTRTKTAKSIRRVASFAVEKPDKTSPHMARILESEGGKDEWSELGTYQGLTDTRETYNEYEASEFEVTESYDEEGEDTDAAGLDPEKRSDIQTALTLALEQGLSYEDAGEAVGWSSSWVSNRVQDYRDGEYQWLDIDAS